VQYTLSSACAKAAVSVIVSVYVRK